MKTCLKVDVERADLGESGGDAHCRDAVKLGCQLAVFPEPCHDLVLRAGPNLRQDNRPKIWGDTATQFKWTNRIENEHENKSAKNNNFK